MLETIDLSATTAKKVYQSEMETLSIKLGALQREARKSGIPSVIVFEGWDAAGKGTVINELTLSLDPRGFAVHPISRPSKDEYLRPYLWRFWTKTPARGRIGIFDRSWYGRVLVERVDKLVKKSVWKKAYGKINAFERQLTDDGTVIIKIFLHIDKKEQKKRFEKLEKHKVTAWKVTKEDWKHHDQHDKYVSAIEDMLLKTNKPWAPWTVVPAHDHRTAVLHIFKVVTDLLENQVKLVKKGVVKKAEKALIHLPEMPGSVLDSIDLSKNIAHSKYEKKLDSLQKRLREIEHEIFLKRIGVMIAYEGWDASGKGGNIRRMVHGLDPRGYEVIPVVAPNDVEKQHHYLWRFWRQLPKSGHIALFDRSWYGRVLVERVEGFCSTEEWQRAYNEINETESQWVESGCVLIKFWIHISPEEQLKRFKARENTPHKKWKITKEDWRNREKWDTYYEAVDEMIQRTSTIVAPWTVIEGESKHFARIKTIETVIAAIERRLK